MARRSWCRTRRGFTLMEVLVALAAAAMVLLAVRGLVEVVGESAARTLAVARQSDVEANADRLLRSLVGRVESGGDTSDSFDGGWDRVRFTTWCTMPAGWQERCRVEVRLEPADTSRRLVVVLPHEPPLVLVRDPSLRAFRYLARSDTGAAWIDRWESRVVPPPAIALTSAHGAVIYRIGERGR